VQGLSQARLLRTLRALALATLLLLGACEPAERAPKISGAWSPATAPSVTVGAAYMRIRSHRADVLMGATSPVAEKVEMHTNFRVGAVARMRRLDSLSLSPHVMYTFAPGGMHFMLMGLHAPLASDSRFPMTLHFREAGDVEVMVTVTAPGAGPPAD
jgi:periplasmic copper chaperone A